MNGQNEDNPTTLNESESMSSHHSVSSSVLQTSTPGNVLTANQPMASADLGVGSQEEEIPLKFDNAVLSGTGTPGSNESLSRIQKGARKNN